MVCGWGQRCDGSSARERVPSILQKQERRILSARGWTRTRRSTSPAVETTRSTTLARTSWRAVSLTHTVGTDVKVTPSMQMSFFSKSGPHPPTPANADRLHLGDRQYQSVEFYNTEKRLIDRYEEVSGGVKADISPDPLYLFLKKSKSRGIITRAGLLAIIQRHYKMGNLTQTKMGMQLRSPLACTKTRLILVSLQTSNHLWANV